MFAYVQRLSKALLLPVAVLPIAALLVGFGYALAPAVIAGAAAGPDADTTSAIYLVGNFMIKAGLTLVDGPHIALIFAIGVSVGMAKKNDGTAAVAGIVSWLIITCLLTPAVTVGKSTAAMSADQLLDVIGAIKGGVGSGTIVDGVSYSLPAFNMNDLDKLTLLAFQKIENPFIGIICGLLAGGCYNKFKDVKLPEFLALFSGKRCVAIMCGLFSCILAAILAFIWPWVFRGLYAFGNWILSAQAIGVGVYMFANRLLMPVGLHHVVNAVFWFPTVGIGDITNFLAGKKTGDPGITWSLGCYQSGFFPCMMFGIPGAALAFILCSKNRKATIGLVGATALCAFVVGITEPFEFLFMFLAFPLYVIYALLYGIFGVTTYIVGFRAGFSFSAGCVDLVVLSQLPAAANTWMIIPLGIAAFVVFFLVFFFYCKATKLAVPGSDEAVEQVKQVAGAVKGGDKKEEKSNGKFAEMANKIFVAVGGAENIEETDYCVTRLRLKLKDGSKVDDDAVKAAGAGGLIKPTKNTCQVVIGTQVERVYKEFIKLTGEE